MKAALAAVESLVGVEPAVLGIHLEGPFLSPEKVGVNDPRAVRRPTADDLATIAARRAGVTLVTLAPEQVPEGFIAQLSGGRRARRARSFDGDLRTDLRGNGRGHDRLHPSVQRHAVAASPRALVSTERRSIPNTPGTPV